MDWDLLLKDGSVKNFSHFCGPIYRQVEEYLNDILMRIMSYPINRLRELLPDQWKPVGKDGSGLIITSP